MGRMSAHHGLTLAALAMLALLPMTAPEAADVRKVATAGEVLPDGTALQSIVSRCSEGPPFRRCVTIGDAGQVTFYGTTGGGIFAIFTQRGVMVEDGELLPDGTTVGIDSNTMVGGLARSVRGFAFPGLDVTSNTLFTPRGAVVQHGATLLDGTTASLNFLGGLAIDARGRVAFHGLNAVFTLDGRQVVARQVLPDGTEARAISFFGGVANAGLRERIAFHGFTDNQQAIFTQDGLVARVGELPDGTDLQSIDLFGGLTINPAGIIAFHGRTDGYDGVFSQLGLLARAGTQLTDGSELEAILSAGGIASNARGAVAFHGATAGRQAVFTQHGVVAKVGDRLRPAGTLEAIHAEGGVAINRSGHVAFHGVVDGKAALIVAR